MGVLQTATFRKVLQEFYAGLTDNPDLCASFEIPPGETWIQLVRDALNMAWSFDAATASRLEKDLATRLPHCRIGTLDVGTFVTFDIELPSVSQMADVLDWLFTTVYRLPHDYQCESKLYSL